MIYIHLCVHVSVCVCVCVCALSHIQLFAASWTIASQVPPPKEFSRQEYWIELPFPTPGDFLDPGRKSKPLLSPERQVDSLPLAPPGSPLYTFTNKLNYIYDEFHQIKFIYGLNWVASIDIPPIDFLCLSSLKTLRSLKSNYISGHI